MHNMNVHTSDIFLTSGLDALLQDRGGPEDYHTVRRNDRVLAGLWVATHSLALLSNNEAAEGGELDCFAAFETVGDFFENELDESR